MVRTYTATPDVLSVIRTELTLARLRTRKRTSGAAWMVAGGILCKWLGIWYIAFPAKVPLLALNVRDKGAACWSGLLTSLAYRCHLFRRVCGRFQGCAFELLLQFSPRQARSCVRLRLIF